jgi:hypothetical protein
MTFAEGITLGLLGTILTIIGFIIAYRLGPNNEKEDEEKIQKERLKKIFPWWN